MNQKWRKKEAELDREVDLYVSGALSWRRDANGVLSFSRKGAEKLVLEGMDALIEQGLEVAWNTATWGPAISYPRKGYVIRPAGVINPLIQAYARMGGWLKGLSQIPGAALVTQGMGDGHNGVNSDACVVNPWAAMERWPSPGGLVARTWKVRAVAGRILEPLGIRPNMTAVLRAAVYGSNLPRKAGFQAAALTLLGGYEARWGSLPTYREARAILADPARWEGIGARVRNRQRIRTAVGLRPPFRWCHAEMVSAAEAAGATGMARRIRRVWGRIRPQEEGEGEHTLLALLHLYGRLGREAQRLVDSALATPDPAQAIHDIGVALGEDLEPEARDWLIRHGAGQGGAVWQDACRIAGAWKQLLALGWEPEGPHPLRRGRDFLASLEYEGARAIPFAREAARWGVAQRVYPRWEDRWLRAQEGITHQTVPAPGGSAGLADDELRLVQLEKSDPRALFIGHHTGCCQHPGGAGESCAWHSVESPDGAVWVVLAREKILAQAWVWRTQETIVLDNVEAMGHEGREERIRALFIRAAEWVVARGALGIERVLVGTGMADVDFEGPTMDGPRPPSGVYTDARRVWRIAG